MKKPSWINRLKKTAPELPYQPPIWLGDHSNGENYHEITPEERRMRELILREGAERARYYGMERREFMASGLGIAFSMSVINLVNGCSEGSAATGGFDPKERDAGNDAGGSKSKKDAMVGMNAKPDPEECAAALQYSDMFIFDVQTHRVERTNQVYDQFLMSLPQGRCGKDLLDCYSKDEYTRKFFLESDTTVTILSGVPAIDGNNPLTNEEIAATRDFVKGIASESERVITHAMVLPNYNHDAQLAMMPRIHEEHGPLGAWKCYTPWGPGDGVTGFWLDDEKTGIPFIEQGRKIGVKTFCCHKGLPLPAFDNNYGDPKDIGVVAKMFPDCKFVVYHSAYQFGNADETKGYTDGNKDGVNSLVTALKDNGFDTGKNVYGELGSTWASIMTNTKAATHVLGKLLKHLGEDNVVWGTDCMWYGSPQPQIAMFMSFKMDEEIRKQEGYPDLTADVKAKILGLNAAKIFGLDPKAKRCGVEESKLAQYKRELDTELGAFRWAFQAPPLRTRRAFFEHVAFHRAAKTPG
ncbi:MAG TPA: amidohydrolase family protein [Polyangiales bacterium]|nr:amidohydrolase family protein [Polyangiales bacterium]